MFKKLRDNIKTILDTVSSIQVVYTRPTFVFDGYPAAFIVPVSSPSEVKTTNENERIYTFRIWTFVEYDQTQVNTAYDALMDVIDDVLDAIDAQESPELDPRPMANGINGAYTLIEVMATPGEFVPDEETKVLAGEITVRCKVRVDLTLL